MNNYIDYDSDVDIFMSSFLFPLTCGFSDTSEVVDFKVHLYVSTFLDHYYAEYYMNCDDYDLNVFASTERGEAKMYSAFSSPSIL